MFFLLIPQQDNWKDGRRWQLTIATELPELEEKQFSNRGDRGFGSGNRGGGFRGGRGRSFGGNGGRGNRFQNGGGGFRNNRGGGGQKRSFSQAFDYWRAHLWLIRLTVTHLGWQWFLMAVSESVWCMADGNLHHDASWIVNCPPSCYVSYTAQI